VLKLIRSEQCEPGNPRSMKWVNRASVEAFGLFLWKFHPWIIPPPRQFTRRSQWFLIFGLITFDDGCPAIRSAVVQWDAHTPRSQRLNPGCIPGRAVEACFDRWRDLRERSTFSGLATIWPANSLLTRRRSLAAFLQSVGDSSYLGAERHSPDYVAQNKRPQRGLRTGAVSCFWIPHRSVMASRCQAIMSRPLAMFAFYQLS